MTAIYYCDTELEFIEQCNELNENQDFTYLGNFDSIQDIYYELNYQGFDDIQIEQFSKNRYGNCLEIIEYSSHYEAYFGAR